MAKTTNYQLNKPSGSDYYSIDDFNQNSDTLDSALGGAKVSFLTAASYDKLSTHPQKTIYFVTDGNTVTVYLGDVKLSGGSVPQGLTARAPLTTAQSEITGAVTVSDVNVNT